MLKLIFSFLKLNLSLLKVIPNDLIQIKLKLFNYPLDTILSLVWRKNDNDSPMIGGNNNKDSIDFSNSLGI